MSTAVTGKLSDEDFKKEVDRISLLVRECLAMNGCKEGPSVAALVGIVLNVLLTNNYTYAGMATYFERCIEQAKPFFPDT
jgi:hypothetical protein